MDKIYRKIAIATESPGGLTSPLSQHFGKSDCFTLVETGQELSVRVLQGIPHSSGGCLSPVILLAEQGVEALVVGGIGRTPLEAFAQRGIDVFLTDDETVTQAVCSLLQGRLKKIQDANCGCSH